MSLGDNSGITSGYKFDISNGAVTGEERVIGSHTFNLHLPSEATFAVGTGSVTETITGTHASETLQFAADASDATLYHLASDQTVISNPTTLYGNSTFGYGFTIANGAVTAMSVTHSHGTHTSTHTLHTGPTTTFSVGADGTVTETSIAGHTIDSTTFAPAGTAGLYAVASETESFIQAGSATTRLDIDPYERAEFTIDASGTVSGVQRVLADGSTKTVTPGNSTTYSQLAAGYVLEVQTHGTHTAYELYHDGNGDGIYTAVAHGSGSTVDLVGLQTQISASINAVL